MVGRTPLTAELAAGSHEVTFTLAEHVPVRRTVQVEAGKAQSLPAAHLQLESARLALSSVPAGASVTLNGTYEGLTPVEIVLVPRRTHEIRGPGGRHTPRGQEGQGR